MPTSRVRRAVYPCIVAGFLAACARTPAPPPPTPAVDPASATPTPPATDDVAPTEPPPKLPEQWRAANAVAYACRSEHNGECLERLVTDPRVGSTRDDCGGGDERVDGPCPTDDVVGVCDGSEFFGTIRYSYAPTTAAKAAAQCHARFWPGVPEPGRPAAFVDPEPPTPEPGCTLERPPPLETASLCLDLPVDLTPARAQGVRYDPPLNPPWRTTLVGQFKAGSYHQVFVYRHAPLALEPACPEMVLRRSLGRAADSNFVQVRSSVFLQGEWLEMTCLSPASIPGPAERMCGEGVLRWCDDE
ncbi:MAG: hypothetical protein AAF721_22335 [Myxococcota bacterium]